MADGSVVVDFTAPVQGVDRSDGSTVTADRHRVAAAWARQDREETLFIDDHGEVVARWATRLIARITWPEEGSSEPSSSHAGVGTKPWRDAVKAQHPRAYEPWTPDEEHRLQEGHAAGSTLDELARKHGRRPGGIQARLVRLGLVEPEDAPDIRPLKPARDNSSLRAEPKNVAPVEECMHGLTAATCSLCKNLGKPAVCITGGGQAYHSHPRCPALLEGQRIVEARHGQTEPVETVQLGSGRLAGRSPCKTCHTPE